MARPRKHNYKAIYADYKKLQKKNKYPRNKKDIADRHNTSVQSINHVIAVMKKVSGE